MYKDVGYVLKKIKDAKTIIISAHISPDGDSVSSSMALALSIEKLGKNPIIILEKYSKNYSFLKGHEFIYKGQDFINLNPDLFFAMDCGSIERLGNFKPIFEKSEVTVNIDHHISNNNFGKINFVNINASSTSEVVFEIIKDFDVLDKDIATAIYTGIIFDTFAFKHSSTTYRTHEIAACLLKYGIDSSFIHTNILYSHSFEKAKILSKAIENISFDNKVCYSFLTKKNIIEECKASYSDLEGVVGYLIDFENVDTAVFFYEKLDGTVKVSFRSKQLDVNKIANVFGGGGHKLASGATLNCSLEEAKDKILKEINANI